MHVTRFKREILMRTQWKFLILTLGAALMMSACGGSSSGGDSGSGDNLPLPERIVESSTLIQWEDTYHSNGVLLNWKDAKTYCENLEFGGYDDWTLPGKEALESLEEGGPSLFNYSYLHKSYWSSTLTSIGTSVYYVNMYDVGFESLGDSIESSTLRYVRCSRSGPFANSSEYFGRWAYADSGQVLYIDKNFFTEESFSLLGTNHLKLGNSHLIRAGIQNVKFKATVAQITDSIRTTSAERTTQAYSGIGGLDVIIRCINDNSCEDQSTESNESGEVSADLPTGDVEITVSDGDNNATFEVSVIGEESDAGVLTVTDKAYNFKSTLTNGNDWRYFGYNDGETTVTYTKKLNICNIGTADISGGVFSVTLDDSAADIKRSFSHEFEGLAPLASGSCISKDVSFSFYRPSEDREVRINIAIQVTNPDYTVDTWYDYASLTVSQYPAHKLYFLSKGTSLQTMSGILVAPGRNLLNVEFRNSGIDNFVRVPLVGSDVYEVVVTNPDLSTEETYMISSGVEPDSSKMTNFTDAYANEPDNSVEDATLLPLMGGESVAYLPVDDIDFYQLVDLPTVKRKIGHLYVDMNLTIPFNTELNSSTVSSETVHFTLGGTTVAGEVTYDAATKSIIFDPDANLTAGTYTITLGDTIKSNTGYSLQEIESWNVTAEAYPSTSQIIGTYTPSVNPYVTSVKVSGRYAYGTGYVSEYGGPGLHIVDIGDPKNPVLAGSFDNTIGGTNNDVFLSGDYAYIASYYGLVIANVTDPANPFLAGSYLDGNYTAHVAVSGDYAYMSVPSQGLVILDISNPGSPTKVATYSDSLNGDLTLSGGYAYIGANDSSSNLTILNISDPLNPSLVRTFDVGNIINGIVVSGNYAYIAEAYSGLVIVDVSTPTTPFIAGRYDCGETSDVFVSGNYAYVTSKNNSELIIIDITDPANPFWKETIALTAPSNIAVSGNFLYSASQSNGLSIVNIQQYQAESIVNASDTMTATLYNHAADDIDYSSVAISDDGYLYAGEYAYGLMKFDLTDPLNPSLVGSYVPGSVMIEEIELKDGSAYIAYDSIMREINSTDMTFLRSSNGSGSIHDIAMPALSNGYVYTSNFAAGLDIFQEHSTTLTGTYHTLENSDCQAVETSPDGQYVYLGDGSTVQVLNVSNPASPSFVTNISTSSTVYNMLVSDNYLYVANGDLEIYSITSPSSPQLLGKKYFGPHGNMAISGNYLYLAQGGDGLFVFDISNKYDPVLKWQLSDYAAYDVAVLGNYAYVASTGAGIVIIDISRLNQE